MRRREIIEGVLALVAFVAFFVTLFGASMLLHENKTGWLLCAAAFVVSVPVVVLMNRREA